MQFSQTLKKLWFRRDQSKIRFVIVLGVTVSLLSLTGISVLLFKDQDVKNGVGQLSSVIKNAIKSKFDFLSPNDVSNGFEPALTKATRDVGSTLPWQRIETFAPTDLEKVVLNHRSEFEEIGEYQLVNLADFLEQFGFGLEAKGDLFHINAEDFSIVWQQGKRFFSDSRDTLQSFDLPLIPVTKQKEIFFPIRILAERLGLLTKFEDSKVFVAKPPANFSKMNMRLIKSLRLNTSEVSLSYFHNAFETSEEIFLIVDHSNDVYRFAKPNYEFSKITIPQKYGYLGHLHVDEESGKLYVSTQAGDFLSYDLQTGELNEIIGEGSQRPKTIGAVVPTNDLNLLWVHFFVFDEYNQNIVYVLSQDTILKLNLEQNTATVIADQTVVMGIKFLGIHEGHPFVIDGSENPKMVLVNPETLETRENASFFNLFKGQRIYGARYLKKQDRWIIVSSSTKEIVEALMPEEFSPDRSKIIRRTAMGDEIAFLNNFGGIAPSINPEGSRIMIIDSDGYNLIFYEVDGEFTVLENEKLIGESERVLLPIGLLSKGTDLYIMANLSQKVYRYSLLDDVLTPFLGNGSPERDYQTSAHRLKIGIGYSAFLSEDDEGHILVSDYFNRRILKVKKDVATNLFPPPHWEHSSSIQAFAEVEGELYYVDPAFGLIFKKEDDDPAPKKFAGVFAKWGDGEQTRRKEALESYAGMDNVQNVRFGYIQGMVNFNDNLLVTDQYRHGIWQINPKNGDVNIVAGMRAPTNYHYGGFVGNVGLSAKEIRFGGLQFLTYDRPRNTLLVPTQYGGTVVAISDDLQKSIELIPDVKIELAADAVFIGVDKLAISDTSRNTVHLFSVDGLTEALDGYAQALN